MKSDKSEEKTKRPKKIKRPKSINVMLWRYFTFFAVGLILIVAIISFVVLGTTVNSQAKRRVRSVGEDFVNLLSEPLVPTPVVESKINDYAMLEGVNVFIFDPHGDALFIGATLPQETLESVYDLVESKVGEWEDGKVVEFNTRVDKKSTCNYAACVRYNGLPCKLFVRFSSAPIADSVRQMELYIIIIALGAVLVAFFISYSLAERLSRPVRNMSATAKKLAGGDYGVQFASAEYAEIANLSYTLNHMKDEIKKSDEFQKELLANVSHDLKTPLTMIKAYASMIKEISGDDPEKRDKHLQVIIEESDRLTGLVNDILSVSKVSSGLQQPNNKVFNLTELVYSVINSFNYLQETQDYKIMVDIDANLYTLADEEKIKQVLYNFVSNAVNYTGENKLVYVSLKFQPEENAIRFAVRDTGKGISQEELEHVWDRYYRSQETHTRPVKGTGLGLSICKAILESHRFNYGASSEVGKGSVFFVDFPCVPSTPEEKQG